VQALADEAGSQQLRLWAHGDLPAAGRLAAAAGFERVRALWQMRRSLQTQLDRPHLADGITIRTFRIGEDEDAWTALNRRAFATHPEQGAWTRADLDLREQEPWFNPEGFFLAERDRRIVGFHWTKIHGQDGQEGDHEHQAIGEVYVVGVDPGERGSGLGRALTLVGLRYLRSRGLFQVMLYVDESNTPAIRLYESLGFTHWDTDVMFGRAPGGSGGSSPHASKSAAGSGGSAPRSSTSRDEPQEVETGPAASSSPRTASSSSSVSGLSTAATALSTSA
jgi:mycothiol synthase